MTHRNFFAWLFVLSLAAVALSVTWPGSAVRGQEDEEDAPAAAPAKEARAAPDHAKAGDAEPAAQAPKSRLVWIVQSSGVIGVFIFCLSVYFGAIVIRLFLEMRAAILLPPEEVEICDQLLAERNFQGLYSYTAKCASFFGKVVNAGIGALNGGDLDEAREVMDRHAEVETVNLERQISPLAVLGTLGPMIGLVGTLKGMIASFSVIALSDTQMRASEVAGGISEALLLTFEGVALSVPAIYFFSFFRNRMSVISAETMLAADDLIRRLIQQAKHKPVAAAAPRA